VVFLERRSEPCRGLRGMLSRLCSRRLERGTVVNHPTFDGFDATGKHIARPLARQSGRLWARRIGEQMIRGYIVGPDL